jgi:hypothetical protein
MKWILILLFVLFLIYVYLYLQKNAKKIDISNSCGYVSSFIDLSGITNDQIEQLISGQPVTIPNGWRMYTSDYMNVTIQLTNLDQQTLTFTNLNIQYKESTSIQLPLSKFTNSLFLVRLNQSSETINVTFDQTLAMNSYCFSNTETINILQPQFNTFINKLNGFIFETIKCNIDLSQFSDFENLLLYTKGSNSQPIGSIGQDTCNVSIALTDPNNPSINYTTLTTNNGTIPYSQITTWTNLYFTVNTANIGDYIIALSNFINSPINITVTKRINDHSKDLNPPAGNIWDLITYNIQNTSSQLQPFIFVPGEEGFGLITFNLINFDTFVQKFNNINYGAFLNTIPFINDCNDCYSCVLSGIPQSICNNGMCKEINQDCSNTSTYIIPNIISCDTINDWPVCPGGNNDPFCNTPIPECVQNCLDGEDAEEYAGCMIGCGLGSLLLSRCKN